jgi:enoyl-CoA hydratase
MSTDSVVQYEIDGHVALITLNRPEARNAVNSDVATAMEAAIDRMEDDGEVWVGVLRATTEGQSRPVFCAGADLKEINAGRAASLWTRRGGFGGITYRGRTKPLIAAVDGLATAGGCEIVLSVDLVVATTRSSFGLAEVTRNLIAGAGGLFRLPQAIGRGPALEMILTGQPISAERAHQLGLVNRLVEPGAAVEEALALAAQITAAAPLAVWASRRVVLAGQYAASEQEMIELSESEFDAIQEAQDTREGLAAFIEKRPPLWKAR